MVAKHWITENAPNFGDGEQKAKSKRKCAREKVRPPIIRQWFAPVSENMHTSHQSIRGDPGLDS